MSLYQFVWRLPPGLRDEASARLAAAGGDAADHETLLEQAFLLQAAAAKHVLQATIDSGRESDLEDAVVGRLLARYAPEDFGAWLLAGSADLLESSRGVRRSLAWRMRHLIDDGEFPDGLLRTWRAAMTGIQLADLDKIRAGAAAARRSAGAHDQAIVELWRALTCAVELDGYSAGLRGIGAARRLRELAYASPNAWAQTLPWLLKAGHRAERHVEPITAELWAINPEVRDAVSAAAQGPDGDLSLAAMGIREIVGADGPANATALADLAARALDRSVYAAPTPLGAPSATWMADLGLEAALRSGTRAAVARAAGHFTAMPSTEEEGHVGYLIAQLAAALEAVLPAAARTAVGSTGPELTVSSRVNGKREESTTGADLALVVKIDVRGAMVTEFAEVVQVKKSVRLHEDVDRDQWTIATSQMNDLLERSPTAVYWLLANDGNILVVPAKLLAAVAVGSNKHSQQTFQVGYAALRHAGIDLAQFIVDLLVGAWLGSDRANLLDYAKGSGGQERPYAMIALRVTVGAG